jgi:hypothetical protein
VLLEWAYDFVHVQPVLRTEVERKFAQVLSMSHLDRSCLSVAKLYIQNKQKLSIRKPTASSPTLAPPVSYVVTRHLIYTPVHLAACSPFIPFIAPTLSSIDLRCPSCGPSLAFRKQKKKNYNVPVYFG